MSKHNEAIHLEITKLMHSLQCNFWDACVEFCANNDIEPDDFVKQIDDVTINRIKQCAIEQRMIRRKILGDRINKLPFE